MCRHDMHNLLSVFVAMSAAQATVAAATVTPLVTPPRLMIPVLLDFQPMVLEIDAAHDIEQQLASFCSLHLIDASRCGTLQDALADIVRFEPASGATTTHCKPSDESVAPAFASIKNILVAVETPTPASFTWMRDKPRHIATDMCNFFARSLSTTAEPVEEGVVACIDALDEAFESSFHWINSLSACDSISDGDVVEVAVALDGSVAEVVGAAEAAVETVKAPEVSELELSDSETVTTVDEDETVSAIENNSLDSTHTRDGMVFASESMSPKDEETTASDDMAESQSRRIHEQIALLHTAVSPLVLAVLLAALSVLLGMLYAPFDMVKVTFKRFSTSGQPSERSHHQEAPLPSAFSPLVDRDRQQEAMERAAHALMRAQQRSALHQWVEATHLRPQFESHPPLRVDVGVASAGYDDDDTVSVRSSVSTPRSHRPPSFALAASLSFLTTRSLPCTVRSPAAVARGGGPDTPMARVNRLLKSSSATAELLDQFELDGERQAAACRIQRTWRSGRRPVTATDMGGKKLDHTKGSYVAVGPAALLVRRVRRLGSRVSPDQAETATPHTASSA